MTNIDTAIAFLRTHLAAGPVAASQVLSLAHSQGIAERTLRRAKARLGVRVKRLGQKGRQGGGSFTWELDGLDGQEVKQLGSQNIPISPAIPISPPTQPCSVCGGIEFWQSGNGPWYCCNCHKKPYFQLLHLWTV